MAYDTEKINSIPILDVCQLLNIEVRKKGQNYSILCPAHADRNYGSCFLNIARNRWHCFVCNEGGTVIDLVMKVNNCSFVESAKILSGEYGVNTTKRLQTILPKKLQSLIGIKASPVVIDTIENGEIVPVYIGDSLKILHDENEELYKEMIDEFCQRRISQLVGFINQGRVFVQLTGVPIQDVYAGFIKQIREIEDVSLEWGGGNASLKKIQNK